MRSILDVIVACKDQAGASDEELRLTVVALSTMLGMVEREERSIVEAVLTGGKKASLLAHFAKRESEIRFQARKMPPADYLGPDYTPGTSENKRLREVAENVFEKATGQKL